MVIQRVLSRLTKVGKSSHRESGANLGETTSTSSRKSSYPTSPLYPSVPPIYIYLGRINDEGVEILSRGYWLQLGSLCLDGEMGNEGIKWLLKAEMPQLRSLFLRTSI